MMNHGLKNLPTSLGLGKHSFITIKTKFVLGLCYNNIAIPVAALFADTAIAAYGNGFERCGACC
jgi:cation transport ATPase